MRPFSFGMLLPCLNTQYLFLKRDDVVSMAIFSCFSLVPLSVGAAADRFITKQVCLDRMMGRKGKTSRGKGGKERGPEGKSIHLGLFGGQVFCFIWTHGTQGK